MKKTTTKEKPMGEPAIVLPPAAEIYTCPEPDCAKSFPTPMGLAGHSVSHQTFICPDCGDTMPANASGNHARACAAVYNDPKREVECGCCGTIVQLRGLTTHIGSKGKGSKTYCKPLRAAIDGRGVVRLPVPDTRTQALLEKLEEYPALAETSRAAFGTPEAVVSLLPEPETKSFSTDDVVTALRMATEGMVTDCHLTFSMHEQVVRLIDRIAEDYVDGLREIIT